MRLQIKPDVIDYKAETWYTDTTKLIKQLYGENWRLFADLLAATSPRSQVKKNWRTADRILSAYLNCKAEPEKYFNVLIDLLSTHINNVLRALQGKQLQGQKVYRFAENLKGNLDCITIDVWICRAYGIEHKQLTKSVYDKLEKRIVADAKRRKIRPANWQAILWYTIRRLHGKNQKSFVSVYRSIFCETPCFAFMQED